MNIKEELLAGRAVAKRRKNDKQMVFNFIFPILFGLVLSGFSLVVFFLDRADRAPCTTEIDAVITGYASSKPSGTTGSMGKGVSHTPIFRYTYNNEEYESQSDTFGLYREDVGTTHKIWVDPDNPRHLYYEELGKVTMIVYLVSGFLGIFIMIVQMIKFVKRQVCCQ